jgi:hypothetical protein
MTPESSSITTKSPLLHCQHRFPSRRFCRLPIADNGSGLCFKHTNQQRKERDLAELASALTGKCEDFQTAAGINHSLGELYKLLADNKIAPRRAAVLAYISNLLLRTIPVIYQETHGDDDHVTVIWDDAPRPDRSQEPDYSPSVQRT